MVYGGWGGGSGARTEFGDCQPSRPYACVFLYVFFVLSFERRRVLHVNVTAHPYAAWAAQQLVQAIGLNADIVRLIRHRDGIYGAASTRASTTWASSRSRSCPGHRGKTDLPNVGSVRCAANCWIIWWSWGNGICCASCGPTLPTTKRTDRTWRSTATRPSHASSRRRMPAAYASCREPSRRLALSPRLPHEEQGIARLHLHAAARPSSPTRDVLLAVRPSLDGDGEVVA